MITPSVFDLQPAVVEPGGDVTIQLKAPGREGMHFIELYPSINQGVLSGPSAPSPDSTANATYLQLPMLNHVDHPGEELPAFRPSFEVRSGSRPNGPAPPSRPARCAAPGGSSRAASSRADVPRGAHRCAVISFSAGCRPCAPAGPR